MGVRILINSAVLGSVEDTYNIAWKVIQVTSKARKRNLKNGRKNSVGGK